MRINRTFSTIINNGNNTPVFPNNAINGVLYGNTQGSQPIILRDNGEDADLVRNKEYKITSCVSDFSISPIRSVLYPVTIHFFLLDENSFIIQNGNLYPVNGPGFKRIWYDNKNVIEIDTIFIDDRVNYQTSLTSATSVPAAPIGRNFESNENFYLTWIIDVIKKPNQTGFLDLLLTDNASFQLFRTNLAPPQPNLPQTTSAILPLLTIPIMEAFANLLFTQPNAALTWDNWFRFNFVTNNSFVFQSL